MTVSAKSGKGAKLLVDISGTDTLIYGVQDIESPEIGSGDEYDATHHESDGKEYVTGLKDGGEITLPVVFDGDDAGQAHLLASAGSDIAESFTLKLPDTDKTQMTFDAKVKSFKATAPVQGVLTANLVLRVNGAVTLGNWTV